MQLHFPTDAGDNAITSEDETILDIKKIYVEETAYDFPRTYEVLEEFFKDKPQNRNFLFYHLGTVSDDTEKKVRVNGKWWPKNTHVNYPNELKDFKKTTMIRRTGREKRP